MKEEILVKKTKCNVEQEENAISKKPHTAEQSVG